MRNLSEARSLEENPEAQEVEGQSRGSVDRENSGEGRRPRDKRVERELLAEVESGRKIRGCGASRRKEGEPRQAAEEEIVVQVLAEMTEANPDKILRENGVRA